MSLQRFAPAITTATYPTDSFVLLCRAGLDWGLLNGFSLERRGLGLLSEEGDLALCQCSNPRPGLWDTSELARDSKTEVTGTGFCLHQFVKGALATFGFLGPKLIGCISRIRKGTSDYHLRSDFT